MDFKDLLDLHEKLETRINAYWTYWSVAVFAIGGWLFSGKSELDERQALGVAIGAGVFFLANLGVLWPATKWSTGVRDEIRLKSQDLNLLSGHLRDAFARQELKFRLQLTVALHLVVDIVVLNALFSLVK